MKLKLKSDFYDWYDHAFDLDGMTFQRISKSITTRKQDLESLKNLGFRVPRFGKVIDFYHEILTHKQHPEITPVIQVVVHTDPKAHRGEGKVLLSTTEAFLRHPHDFCVEYIPSNRKSQRLLCVGKRTFWIEYESKDDWRSNMGDVNFKVLDQIPERPRFFLPMFAIDFVGKEKLYAIDLNIAPGLEPLKGIMTASEIVDELKNWLEKKDDI